MKKLIALLLGLVMLLSMTACGKPESPKKDDTKPSGSDTTNTEPADTQNSEPSVPAATEPAVPEDWGVVDRFSYANENRTSDFVISFPYYVGIPEATALVAKQGDGTYIILDGSVQGTSPEVNSVAELFPAYFKQTERVFEVNYGSRYSDGKFALERTECVGIINGYEMYKFVGTHSFTWEMEQEINRKFVAYATQFDNDGPCVYWYVQDETEDQSMFETLESHAYNMAWTLQEVD